MTIHSTAIIDPSSKIGDNVTIGPFTIVGPQCEIGDNTVLSGHVVIESHTKIGTDCQVASGAVLGGLPQDHTFGGEESWVEIGNHCQIREYVTVNRGTGEDSVTKVGDHCLIMAYSHVAHNCQLADNVTMANSVHLAGYVEVGEGVFISGTCMIHQFVKIGRLSFVCPFGGSRQDVPPFAMTEGRPQVTTVGINKVGLKRAGFGLQDRTAVKKAYHHLFFSHLNVTDAVEKIKEEDLMKFPAVEELVEFVVTSKRGIHRPDTAFLKQYHSDEVATV